MVVNFTADSLSNPFPDFILEAGLVLSANRADKPAFKTYLLWRIWNRRRGET